MSDIVTEALATAEATTECMGHPEKFLVLFDDGHQEWTDHAPEEWTAGVGEESSCLMVRSDVAVAAICHVASQAEQAQARGASLSAALEAVFEMSAGADPKDSEWGYIFTLAHDALKTCTGCFKEGQEPRPLVPAKVAREAERRASLAEARAASDLETFEEIRERALEADPSDVAWDYIYALANDAVESRAMCSQEAQEPRPLAPAKAVRVAERRANLAEARALTLRQALERLEVELGKDACGKPEWGIAYDAVRADDQAVSHAFAAATELPPQRRGQTHELKLVEPHFSDVAAGRKTFEVRRDDRGFCVGDWLHLRHYNAQEETYGDRSALVKVTSLLRGPQFGIEDGYVVMSIVLIWTETAGEET